jgi:hypothetical protein
MGFETIAFVIFAQLMEVSSFIEDNFGLLFFSFLLLILWITGIITVVRRWRAE